MGTLLTFRSWNPCCSTSLSCKGVPCDAYPPQWDLQSFCSRLCGHVFQNEMHSKQFFDALRVQHFRDYDCLHSLYLEFLTVRTLRQLGREISVFPTKLVPLIISIRYVLLSFPFFPWIDSEILLQRKPIPSLNLPFYACVNPLTPNQNSLNLLFRLFESPR